MYFLNYHSRFALINGFTADQTAIDATSSAAVAARAAQLAPIYQAEGLSPEQAAQKAQAAAGTLTIGKFTNATRYFASYPENIKMLGFSFNTAMLRTGTLFSGEISHHLGFPVQRPVEEVLAASLSPIQFTPVFQQTSLGAFGANTVVRGFDRRDKTQFELGLRQLLGPRLYSSQTILGLDLGWVHIHNLPSSSPFDGDSWGYRLIGQSTYDGILGGVTLLPRVVWAQDVNGVTPGPGGAFVAGRRAYNVGLEGDYVNRWTADLSYTGFFGGGRSINRGIAISFRFRWRITTKHTNETMMCQKFLICPLVPGLCLGMPCRAGSAWEHKPHVWQSHDHPAYPGGAWVRGSCFRKLLVCCLIFFGVTLTAVLAFAKVSRGT